MDGCQKAGCQSNLIVLGDVLCPHHFKAISDVEVIRIFREKCNLETRRLAILEKALEGPEADVAAALVQLEIVIESERKLREARIAWFVTPDEDRPAKVLS